MKTYKKFAMLMALVVFGCSKSENGSGQEEKQKSVDADYAVLLTDGNNLTTQLLNANAEVITLNPAQSALTDNLLPQLTAVKGTKFLQYHKDGDCGGKILLHDFSSDTPQEIDLFDDLNDCTLHANAISFSDASIFVAYELENADMTKNYMVRVIDMNSSEFSFVDVAIDKKPVGLAIANDRLFIMTLGEILSKEHSLAVMDLSSNGLIYEMNLGFNARGIFTNNDDDIIISYDELHTTLNSENLSSVYTNYGSGTAPKFTTGTANHFDSNGRLYYAVDSGTISSYPTIPAVYDFSENLVILYAFENFLTEAKRNFEFEIESTTTVAYDEKNNLILIGYKKSTAANKGGILRIKPAPEPAFFDNIDLEGVPFEIIVN